MTDDALMRRQLVLTWAAGLVALSTMALVALALFFLPALSEAWVVAASVAGSLALIVLLFFLVRHAAALAEFAFREDPS